MKDLLLDMKAEVERAKALGQHELDVLVLARLLRRYDSILTRSATLPIPLQEHRGSRSSRSEHQGDQNKARP
jgi:transposase